MLARLASRSAAPLAVRARCAIPLGARAAPALLQRRSLSDGIHDDFKPQKKRVYADEAGDVSSQIAKDIAESKVVLYMKGVPDAPQCGFSNAVVQVLKAEKVPFSAFNVLADPDLREGIKNYSNWPTIPQVYVNGEFIGGCDTTIEMYKSGVSPRHDQHARHRAPYTPLICAPLLCAAYRSCTQCSKSAARSRADGACTSRTRPLTWHSWCCTRSGMRNLHRVRSRGHGHTSRARSHTRPCMHGARSNCRGIDGLS